MREFTLGNFIREAVENDWAIEEVKVKDNGLFFKVYSCYKDLMMLFPAQNFNGDTYITIYRNRDIVIKEKARYLDFDSFGVTVRFERED